MGLRRIAEGTRKAALTLGDEAGNAAISGWAYEMRAWYALTQGDYRGVIAAAEAGEAVAAHDGAAVQLAAQRAKAWARLGDRRQVETALDKGRSLLESLPYPEDTDHHFVVDPAKFDFYAMDCYRIAGEDRLAEMYARGHPLIDGPGRDRTQADAQRRSPHHARGGGGARRRSRPGRVPRPPGVGGGSQITAIPADVLQGTGDPTTGAVPEGARGSLLPRRGPSAQR